MLPTRATLKLLLITSILTQSGLAWSTKLAELSNPDYYDRPYGQTHERREEPATHG
jgi:hypothetical protein